jgi:hypothetical protein
LQGQTPTTKSRVRLDFPGTTARLSSALAESRV